MRVSSRETGHAFEEPHQPTFYVTLWNIAPRDQAYRLILRATHQDGTTTEVRYLRPASSRPEPTGQWIEIPTKKRGYQHQLVVILEDGEQHTLLRRQTSFARLPPDTRTHRDQSPFGTYDYGGAHYTCKDMDVVGPLYVKLGLRYGMFNAAPDVRRRFGLLKGNEPQTVEKYTAVATDDTVPPRRPDFSRNVPLRSAHGRVCPTCFTTSRPTP